MLRYTYIARFVKPKQGLRIGHTLLKSDKHNVGAYLYRCMTFRLLRIIKIYILECNILIKNVEIK